MSVASSDMTSTTTATTPTSVTSVATTAGYSSSNGGVGKAAKPLTPAATTETTKVKESMPVPGLITGQLSPVASKKPPQPSSPQAPTRLAKAASSRSMAPELSETYKSALRSSRQKAAEADEDSGDEDLERYFAEMAAKRDAAKYVRYSDKSQKLLDETSRLLDTIPTYRGHGLSRSRSVSPAVTGIAASRDQRGWDKDHGGEAMSASTSRFLANTPRFPRIDFDDWLEEDCEGKKPAWRQLQDSIKTNFDKPKRTVERNKELNACHEMVLNRRKSRVRRSESPFSMRPDGESFIPRAPSWFASGAMQPRGLKEAFTSTPGSGLYAAPAVGRSQGVEGSSGPPSRYEKLVDDIESRLLKCSILPEHMKGPTRRDFRNAPNPSAGSMAEHLVDEADMVLHSLPRPFYSRPSRADPDYFDFDLQHSVDMFKRPEGAYTPRGPQAWETKLLSEYRAKGDAPLSGHMFTKEASAVGDYRNTNTSYLSAALRTPSFWEHRFASIGSQVRESNPVSLMSIERNRPMPSRFTEYRDPDFADYEDPKELAEDL